MSDKVKYEPIFEKGKHVGNRLISWEPTPAKPPVPFAALEGRCRTVHNEYCKEVSFETCPVCDDARAELEAARRVVAIGQKMLEINQTTLEPINKLKQFLEYFGELGVAMRAACQSEGNE